jgi:20S proteasome alpha/beta subunit
VEYAIEAIKLGSTAIGIQTSDGVVVAVEKRITSTLMEPHTIEKIVEVRSYFMHISPVNFLFHILGKYILTWLSIFHN